MDLKETNRWMKKTRNSPKYFWMKKEHAREQELFWSGWAAFGL